MKTNLEEICGEWDRTGSGQAQRPGQTKVLEGTLRLSELPGQQTWGTQMQHSTTFNQVLAGGDQLSPGISWAKGAEVSNKHPTCADGTNGYQSGKKKIK